MKVKLLAFDSMGTRSMCTLIEAEDARIMIDPGAALGPRRYGLKPHPIERKRLEEHKRLIRREAEEADLIVVTHYHYDHFPRPGEKVDWLKGKRILLKDSANMINFSQRMRARLFLEELRRVGARPEVADSRTLKVGRCRIRFSDPVEHGNDSKLGYVLQVFIRDRGETLIHSSDVEGFVSEAQAKFVLENRPDILICDGPMTYMLGDRFSEADLKSSLRNLMRIVRGRFLQALIIDHHLLRDLEWRNRVSPLIEYAEGFGVELHTAASYMGLREELLEASRRRLYEEFGENI